MPRHCALASAVWQRYGGTGSSGRIGDHGTVVREPGLPLAERDTHGARFRSDAHFAHDEVRRTQREGQAKEATVHDAQGNTMIATSYGPLRATMRDASGCSRENRLLDKQAFVARGLASDLLSMPAMAEAGWDFHFTKNGNQSWATGRDGTKHPITFNPDGHFYLSLLVHDETTVLDPTTSGDVDKQDVRALAASTHPQTNGLSARGAIQPVRWHNRAQGLPTKGPTTTVPKVSGTVHEGHDEKSGQQTRGRRALRTHQQRKHQHPPRAGPRRRTLRPWPRSTKRQSLRRATSSTVRYTQHGTTAPRLSTRRSRRASPRASRSQ